MAPGKTENKLSYWFIFQNDQLLLLEQDQNDSIVTNTFSATLRPHFLREFLLGTFHEIECYCAELAADISLDQQIKAFPLREGFVKAGLAWYPAIAKAYSVINWDKTHQFCGRCGAKTQQKKTVFERVCSSCGLTFYPRISPSIIVLIKKEDQVLMARSPHFPPGRFGLIAGFVEIGENLEETIFREVHEEVGIKIKNLQYFSSQAWPFPDSLMIGFMADYEAGEIKIDNNEIEAADWYRFDNLPNTPSKVSISRKLIDHFVAEAKQKYPTSKEN